MAIGNETDFFVQWHLTERCNLSCKHCYQSGRMTDELSLREIKEVAGEISDMLREWSETYDMVFSRSLTITGGEPFLHEDIFEILEDLRRRGFDVYLLSNGILINREKAKLLSWLGLKGVQVSIEGPEKIHEAIRGKGSFEASLRGIEQLLAAGIRVTLNVTLSDINADHFMEMLELSSAIGVQRVGFSRLVPAGRGEKLLDMMIKREKLEKLYRSIFSLNTGEFDLVTGDPVASQMLHNGGHMAGAIPVGGCAAGVSGFTILPDGTITPCRRLPIPIGNIRKDELREIWATSKVLADLRDRSRYSGKCGRCSRWSNCRGCRAIAYAYSSAKGKDDFLAEDPQCFLAVE